MGTIGSGEFNNRRLLAFQPSFSFQRLSEREENLVLLGCEYLNWLFAVQEFLFRQFIPSIHSVLIYDFNSSVFQAVTYCSMELRSKIWKKEAFPRLYRPVNSVLLNPPFMATYLSG